MTNITGEDIAISVDLRPLAELIIEKLELTTGKTDLAFSLFVYPSTRGSRINYISNCKRNNVYGALKSLLTSWENGMQDIPAMKLRVNCCAK